MVCVSGPLKINVSFACLAPTNTACAKTKKTHLIGLKQRRALKRHLARHNTLTHDQRRFLFIVHPTHYEGTHDSVHMHLEAVCRDEWQMCLPFILLLKYRSHPTVIAEDYVHRFGCHLHLCWTTHKRYIVLTVIFLTVLTAFVLLGNQAIEHGLMNFICTL